MMLVIVNVLDICRGDSSPLHIFKKIDYVYKQKLPKRHYFITIFPNELDIPDYQLTSMLEMTLNNTTTNAHQSNSAIEANLTTDTQSKSK